MVQFNITSLFGRITPLSIYKRNPMRGNIVVQTPVFSIFYLLYEESDHLSEVTMNYRSNVVTEIAI